MNNILRRVSTSEPFKELDEQLDNRFTLLNVLEVSRLSHTAHSDSYLFGSTNDVIKCWDVQSGQLFASYDLSEHANCSVANIERNGFLCNNNLVVILFNSAHAIESRSSIYVWSFKAKENSFNNCGMIDRDSILCTFINAEYFIASISTGVRIYKITEITVGVFDIVFERTLETAATIIKSIRNSLYLTNINGMLLVQWNLDDHEMFKETTQSKTVNIEIVQDKYVMVCSQDGIVSIWNRRLKRLNQINLGANAERDSYFWIKQASSAYSFSWDKNSDIVVMSYNTSMFVVNIKNFQCTNICKRAHRSTINSMSYYKANNLIVYLITKCDRVIRLWRLESLSLVGEIVVSNVDSMRTVPDIGLYLSGFCYDSGLVMWRDADAYTNQCLKQLRGF